MLETFPFALLTAAATLAGSVLLSRSLVAAVAAARAPVTRRRRDRARAREAGWLAERAQHWLRAPAPLGGPGTPGAGFAGLTFDALGLVADARDVRHTPAGAYRLLPVAPCDTLDGCARLLGTEPPAAGGLLVVGTCEVPEAAVAVLVLGPLALVPLPAVPWGWVRSLTTPAVDPLLLAPARPDPVVRSPTGPSDTASQRPMHVRAQRERRMPSWRSPKHTTRRRDRECV